MIQKVTLLLFVLIGISWSHSSLAQNCVPNDNCGAAPKICMQGYIGTTAGFSENIEPFGCSQPWKVHNDQWIAFMPTQSNIIINVEVVGNCSNGGGIQALIHSDCYSDPIDCDVDCNGDPSVGAGIDFTPGATYYLRIDGCNGAICPIKITYFPDGAIMDPPDPIIPKWFPTGLISGPSIVVCPSKIETYTLPLNPCATSYNWKIEGGEAEIINDFGEEYVDNDPLQPGTTVTIIGKNRNVVRVRFKDTCSATIRLCCEGYNGCHTTNITCKTITVKCSSDINKKVKICANDTAWFDPNPIIGGPYEPGEPCGTPLTHIRQISDANGCLVNLNLQVTRNCEEFGLIESFDNSPIKSCENTVKAAVPTYSVFPGGDYVYFITDSINNGSFGTIYERNQTGDFTYNSSYVYNKTYYIVFAVGEKSADYVNLTSNCLRYSYQPITFNKKPTTSCVSVFPTVCTKSVMLKATKDVGIGNWIVLSQVPNSTISFSDKSDPNALFTADLEGTYKLQWNVENEACITTCETELTFKKEGPKAEKTKYTCNASGTSYTVSIKLNGVAPMKVLKGSSKGLLIGNTFTSFPIVAGKPYYLFVKDGQNCDTLKLSGTYLCPEYNGDLLNVEEREQIEEDIQFSLQPNPAKDVLQLQWNGILEGQTGKLELVDMTGRVVQSVVISAQEKQHQMDVRTLPQGNYIVRILFGDVFLQEKLLISRE